MGIVWGLIIFNLDRYIVSSLRKQRTSPTLSWREWITVKAWELARAFPRLLLAVFISVVITRPIELKLFEREIDIWIESKKTELLANNERQKRQEFPQIEELGAQNEKLRQEIVDKERQRDEMHELAMSEALGKSGERTTGRFGKGIVYEQRYQAYLKGESELAELRKQKSTEEARRQIKGMGGLLARLQAHRYLTEQKENGSIALASWFIIGLFILLETAPIVVKLLSERGPYDDIQEAKEHEVYVQEKRRISNTNDDANTRVSLNRRRNAAILEAESRLRSSLIASLESLAAEELRKARREIATTLVQHWKGAELKNFEVRFGTFATAANGHRPSSAVAGSGLTPEPTTSGEATAVAAPVESTPAELSGFDR
jgi:hypothetical protein